MVTDDNLLANCPRKFNFANKIDKTKERVVNIKIILGSKNNSKKEAIVLALKELGINDFEIESLEVNSHVSSKPINEEALVGAHNRNQELFNYCTNNNIDFDLLLSIEGGYEQVDNYYFIITYASIVDSAGNEYFGKSQGLQITKSMFDWVREGKSLNKVIEQIKNSKDNKKGDGISGYLTNSYYHRSFFDSTAIISAIQFMQNSEKSYKNIEKRLIGKL